MADTERSERKRERSFGNIRKLPSGKYQARWTDPDGTPRTGPRTFVTRREAGIYLAGVERDLADGVHHTGESDATFDDFFRVWLQRKQKKSPKYLEWAQGIHSRELSPKWGPVPLTRITSAEIESWYGTLLLHAPSMRARTYSMFRGVLNMAVRDKHQRIKFNPCQIEGAASVDPKRKGKVLLPEHIRAIQDKFPPAYWFLAELACWNAMRFSEFTELRRGDIEDWENDIGTDELPVVMLKLRRGVTYTKGKTHVRAPKWDSEGEIVLPPHLAENLRTHLKEWVGPEDDALLFPSRRGVQLPYATFLKMWRKAVRESGVEKTLGHLVPHDMRHTGNTYTSWSGATLKEFMERGRHKTVSSAMPYQHSISARHREIAASMSRLAENVVSLDRKRTGTTG